jgi:cellulose synthase (UDP-forming)
MPILERLFKLGRRLTASRPPRSPGRNLSVIFPISVALGGAIAVSFSLYFHNNNLYRSLDPFNWIGVPSVENRWILLLPAAIFFLVIQSIRVLSPNPKPWSRRIIASILLVLTLRYILWRTLDTLNFSTPLNGLFSVLLWFMEILVSSGSLILLFLNFTLVDRRKEADRYSQAVLDKSYLPSVNILVPTYNEPDFIIERTLIGCLAIEYPNKTVYLLDDTGRPEIENLARELNCHYITRPDNRHAKAGNLNHALALTDGELVAVFDADFIPCTNFLERTVGFFQNPEIALVQTPQSFYNADPIAYNLGIDDVVIPEEEVFYRYLQPLKDGAGSVVCAGTSFVVRRSALEQVGNFNTESISEDYFTGIELNAIGYKAVYLNQKLSAGLAAESLSAYLQQRLRWARGTLQAFFITANPLTIPGLTFRQRMSHFEGLISWFSPLSRLFFLIIPLLYTFLNIVPIDITDNGAIYIFLPYYVSQMASHHWLNNRSRSVVFSEVLSFILCIPVAVAVVRISLDPFARGFKVTPKGITRTRSVYNWQLAAPLLVLLIVTVLGLVFNLYHPRQNQQELNLIAIWGTYNIFVIAIALIALLDAPRSARNPSLAIDCPVKLIVSEIPCFIGNLERLSESAAEITVNEPPPPAATCIVDLYGENLRLSGRVVDVRKERGIWKARVDLDRLAPSERQELIRFLFCRPDRWPVKETPGEWRSLGLLAKSAGRAIGRAIRPQR